MIRRDVLRAVPVLAGSAIASACGYSLAGRGSFLPDYIRTVAIPLFANRTSFITAELMFTEKVRIEFQSRGRYSVQPAEPGADAVVRGDIAGISASPVGFNENQLASRYRFTVVVNVKFDDLKQQKTLWENPALSFSDEYDLSSRNSLGLEGAAFLEQERVAIDRLSTDFARSVVSAILEAF
jgi:Lipopolysaccharide-assembly